MSRLSALAIAVSLLAGCAAPQSGARISYDRKYDEYRYLRGHVPPFRGELAGAAADQKQAVSPERRMPQETDAIRGSEDGSEHQRLVQQHMRAMLGDAEMMRACMDHIAGQAATDTPAPLQ